MKFGTWLLSLLSPAISKILTAIGFSVISITGMDVIFTQLKAQLTSSLGGLSADTFSVFLLAGGGQGLGMIVGALSTRLLLWQIQNATKILGVNPG